MIWRFWSTRALKVWKNSSWVEVLAADELHVVDHQHVDGAELLLEGDRVLVPERPDELVHELLGREVDDRARGVALADVPGDGVHEMGLAEADAAIEEERVERHRVRFGDAPGCGMGELVRLADHEVLEGEARIERGGEARAHVGLGLAAVGGGMVGLHPGAGCRLPRALDDELDQAHRGILALPQRADAVRVVARDPIAHEARGRAEPHQADLERLEGQRLEPALIRGLAELRAQAAAHPRPLRIDLARSIPIRHGPTLPPSHASSRPAPRPTAGLGAGPRRALTGARDAEEQPRRRRDDLPQ